MEWRVARLGGCAVAADWRSGGAHKSRVRCCAAALTGVLRALPVHDILFLEKTASCSSLEATSFESTPYSPSTVSYRITSFRHDKAGTNPLDGEDQKRVCDPAKRTEVVVVVVKCTTKTPSQPSRCIPSSQRRIRTCHAMPSSIRDSTPFQEQGRA